MKQVIVSIRDVVSETFSRPVFVVTRGAAIRSFLDEVRNPEAGDLHKHPADFDLFCLGSFDDAEGGFDCPMVPELLCKGSAALTAKEE